ncbi:MAG: InlB B-repeat-containing protein [Bacteroidota bacterium]
MNKKKYIWIMAIGCMNLLFFIPGLSQSNPLPTDPGRVSIDSNKYGYQVVNENGDILRGNAIWLWKSKISKNFSDIAYAFDSSYYQTLADSGINTIRLVLFDPWVNSNTSNYSNVLDYSNQSELDWMLEYTDSVVDFASKYNMNVLINYHDVGKYKGEHGNPDANNMGYLKDFWTAIAPYYKNRTHVFYEQVNEPVFVCSEYNNQLLDSMKVIHDLMRNLAPETHISMFTITGVLGNIYDDQTIYDVVARFEERYPDFDWSNASVAFHPYNKDPKKSSGPIQQVMANYSMINTESNFPEDSTLPVLNRDKEVQTADGELMINQTMERLGISWIQHKTNGWNHFNHNWPIILKDAREKGYIWFGDYNEHIMNITAENGWVDPREDTLRVQAGHKIRFEAHPDDGYRFEEWTGDITSGENPVYVDLSGSESSITANFTAIDSFNVITQGTNGWVRLSPPGGRYIDSTIVNICAVPESGYTFSKWAPNDVIDDVSIARQDILVTKDIALTAYFASTLGIVSSKVDLGNVFISPNPVQGDYIRVIVNDNSDKPVEVRVFDITGSKIHNGLYAADNVKIPLSHLNNPKKTVLILEIEVNQKIYRQKAMIY